ncbi:MAG: DUF2510 domain-containing protein [Pseudolysinimonas sp.]
MSDPNALPIAGWYPDPENEAGDRWWNGATWSDHRRPRNAPAGWMPEAAAPVKKASTKKAAAAPAEPAQPAQPAQLAEAAAAIPVPPVAAAPAERPNPYAQPNPYAPTNPYAPANPYQPTPSAGAGMFQPVPGAPGVAAAAYAPYAPAYAPNYAPATPMRNPLALGGMITSLVALICNFILFGAPGIAGAIVSFLGLRKANQLVREGVTAGNGKTFAITGIVTGMVGAFLWDWFYFAVFSPFQFS